MRHSRSTHGKVFHNGLGPCENFCSRRYSFLVGLIFFFGDPQSAFARGHFFPREVLPSYTKNKLMHGVVDEWTSSRKQASQGALIKVLVVEIVAHPAFCSCLKHTNMTTVSKGRSQLLFRCYTWESRVPPSLKSAFFFLAVDSTKKIKSSIATCFVASVTMTTAYRRRFFMALRQIFCVGGSQIRGPRLFSKCKRWVSGIFKIRPSNRSSSLEMTGRKFTP